MNQFAQDVQSGLSASPKRLSSKYFYDEKGDALFQQIMHAEEYYLTRAELEIFTTQKEKLRSILHTSGSFRLVELGAGDGLKTKILLGHFLEQGVDFSYCPVDISPNVLNILQDRLTQEMPDLVIHPLAGDYFKVLNELTFHNEQRNVVFFLGSNIGNFLGEMRLSFLKSIHENLHPGDLLMIGFDLKKDPSQILAAYNDSQGITRDFNLNLLHRINRELGGDFSITDFRHYPTYDPVSGECKSYLISLRDQEVRIEALDQSFRFAKWEPVFMEVSKKYSLEEIAALATQTGFRMVETLTDREVRFAEVIWEVC